MNILTDSNVQIAAYPKPGDTVEPTAKAASSLLRMCIEHHHAVYHHPVAMSHDFGNVKNEQERAWRRQISANYPPLPVPPNIQLQIEIELGRPSHGSNDWVDHHLLAAVLGNAVDRLVTEDGNLLRKAQRLGLGERVASIDDTIAALTALVPQPSNVALLPDQVLAHTLDENDPIFASLRSDYYPDFDGWLGRCKAQHRTCWTITENGKLAALTIVKPEEPPEFGPGGKTLKICLFKVSDEHPGKRYGELLLKSVFDYAYSNAYDSTYVTAFPKYPHVVSFLSTFGFDDVGERTGLGEVVVAKSLRPRPLVTAGLDPLTYHVKYGPKHYMTDVPRFIVPIEPRYHRVLFPEADQQGMFQAFGTGLPAGNSIQKAYLSKGNTRSMLPGSILYFYRSHDQRRLSVVGIVENADAFTCHDTLASYVGKRTVYSPKEIRDLTENGCKEVLAVLFRQSRILPSGLTDSKLREAHVWHNPPQSIMRVPPQGAEWLKANVDLTER